MIASDERRAECDVKWCNEVGEHAVHRRYLASLPAWRGAWLIGVNVVQPRGQSLGIELTIVTKRGEPAIIPLEPREAESVARALVEAAARAAA